MNKLKLTIEIPADLEADLRRIACQERRTLSQQISWEISLAHRASVPGRGIPVFSADPAIARLFLKDLEALRWGGEGSGVNSASVFLDHALEDFERIIAKMDSAWNYCTSEGLPQEAQKELRAAGVRRAHKRFRKKFARQLAKARSDKGQEK